MKIIRMIPTEIEIDGSPFVFSVAEIDALPTIADYSEIAEKARFARRKDWKIHDIHRWRELGDVQETLYYTIENDLLQEVVLADRRTKARLSQEVTQLTMSVHGLEGLIERAGFWNRFVYLFTGKLK